ncbi:sucrase ferredoxin [Deinococcus sp. HMF7620]|uniref:Sucrase ferredoxin n=1 Tax=Deinococcus arboris TaxID=2682977 RepID=A0A7C9M457_9DEIO|nr:sucrase ferredoxin [Deinococcus arboris]MVN85525.1 sucrase ferredoxin [Deinococcus arboris]
MTAAPRLPLCADVSRELNEDPIGTASHWQEVTVLELDVPVWARVRDVANWTPEQSGLFERLRGKVEGSGAGFGLLMSAPRMPGQPLRVRHYTLGAGGYRRRDYLSELPQSEWARGLTDTLLDRENLGGWQEEESPAGPDLHVCTHGTVDAACGRYGVPVFQRLGEAGVRAWRTGHFGGHRFAATAVELPTGLMWAHLTPELAVRVAQREVAPAEAARHLRGFAGLPPLAQAVDRELLLRHGWAWLSAERRAQVDGQHVTLSYTWQGVSGEVRAVVGHSLLSVPGSSHKPDYGEVKQYQVAWA